MSEIPIVVGVGDFVNRSTSISDAHEPLTLILNAITIALEDTALNASSRAKLQSAIDSIDVVRTWTWPYDDLPGDISRNLGVVPRHRFYSDHGGNKPAKMLDEAARRISKRRSKVAIVTGGEALASLTACAAAKKLPPPGWIETKQGVDKVFSPTGRDLGKNIGATHSIGEPIQVYPLFEAGFRAHRGQSIGDNNDESAQLYAEFAEVASSQPYSWNYEKSPKSKEEIGTVSKRNRMICLPYPLLMNAFNTVNLAAACILTSTTFAEELGIPKEKWIYVLGGAGTQDATDFWNRPNYHSSPSIERSLDTGLEVSGLIRDDIDLCDFYSCFPVVPKIAATHLNLPITGGSKPITLLGGLTSFGGAGNNYSMHAITEMTRQIRAGKGRHGLVLANGGVMTYQHVICLSKSPRREGVAYPDKPPLPEVIEDVPSPEVDAEVQGEQDAVIETYTVEYKRDNTPLRAYIVGRLKSTGHRFVANHGDEETLRQLCSQTEEKIGRTGRVKSDGQRNLFVLKRELASRL
ncbi:acetyl-CoA C-acetyltransferase [Exophiala viscosa]|uniref:Acetyl-CoA C-acetyltransferase n=1 Tax=Exophiala viscosa TaxID=2486360 RepID=A0AAN6IBK2_9EURO|nr:acetyl-CoA C-acetyltransferase [Exophiala viscosa]